MSYCRFSEESNVYLYPHVDGGHHCCGCYLQRHTGEFVMLDTLEEVKAHLETHVAAGHRVPQHAFNRVERELAQEREASDGDGS